MQNDTDKFLRFDTLFPFGNHSMFDVAMPFHAQNERIQVQISKDTKLNIIASTGFYLSEYHPDYLKDLSTEEVSNIYIKELTEGIDGTGAKAGIIAEIASNKNEFIGEEEKILRGEF